MTHWVRVAPGLARFLPMLAVASLLFAFAAARLPMEPGLALWNLDLPKIDVPLAVFFHNALAAGRLPLWEDRLGLGFPLYAEGQIGAFYPPNWLIYRLEPLAALDATRVLHLTVAGIGAGVLAMRIGGTRRGAIVAAAVAILGGAIVSKLEWTNLVVAYAWLPWILLPLARRPAPTAIGLVAAGFAWGFQALAGHPNMWLLSGLAAVVLLLATGRSLRSIGRVAAFGLLGGAIGAIQLVPTLVLTGLSVRSLGLSADDVFTSAATPFDPLAFGFAQAFVRTNASGWDIYTSWYPDGIFALLETSAFVGLPVIALAAVGITTRRLRPWLVVAAVMLLIPIIAAFRPGPWLEIPILNGLRSPVRSYIVIGLVIGLIAAVGISRVGWRPVRAGLLRAAVAVGALVGLYVVVLAAAVAAPAAFDAVFRAASSTLAEADGVAARERAVAALTSALPVVVEIGLGVVAVVLVGLPGRRPLVGLTLVALAVAPLVLFAPPVNRLRAAEETWLYDTPIATALRFHDPNRVLTIDSPGFYDGQADRLAAADVSDLEMFSSLNLLASDQLVSAARDDPDAELIRRLVGVDVLVTFGKDCPGEPLERIEKDGTRICHLPARTVPYWIPASAVEVEEPSTSPIRPTDATLDLERADAEAIDAAFLVDQPGEVAVAVDAPVAGYVWIDRAWWPGWSVEVDGVPTSAVRALAGTLVPVPTGAHQIRLRLVPWDVAIGLIAAIIALAVAGTWLIVLRRRGRRSTASAAG